jgi:hypothetical protein
MYGVQLHGLLDVLRCCLSSIYCSYTFGGSYDLVKPLLPTHHDYYEALRLLKRELEQARAEDKVMGDSFEYLPAWRVLVCRECGFCLRPRKEVWIQHLRQMPHCLKGTLLRAQVEL